MSVIDTALQWAFDNKADILNAVCYVIAVASYICRKTPTPDPNTRLGKAYALLDWLAQNTGHAKETGAPACNLPGASSVGSMGSEDLASPNRYIDPMGQPIPQWSGHYPAPQPLSGGVVAAPNADASRAPTSLSDASNPCQAIDRTGNPVMADSQALVGTGSQAGGVAGPQAGFMRVRVGAWLTLGFISALFLLPIGCAMLTAPTSPEGQAQAQEVQGWADYMRTDAQAMAEVEHGGCLALAAIPEVAPFCAGLSAAVPVVQGAADAVAAVLSSAADAAQAKAALAEQQAKVTPALAALPEVPPALQQYLAAQAAQATK